MGNYLTVSASSQDEFTEKRSRFIGTLAPCKSHDEAMKILEGIRKQNHDARHNVWAYILNDGTMRYSDDGEPQGTGGQPVLEVIKRSGLTDVILVVTRYFGGILLGAGGLTRAYAKGAALAIGSCKPVEICEVIKVSLEVDYSQYQTSERILKECGTLIENTSFTDRVSILGVIRCEDLENLKLTITEAFSGNVRLHEGASGYFNMPPKEF